MLETRHVVEGITKLGLEPDAFRCLVSFAAELAEAEKHLQAGLRVRVRG